MSDFTYEDKNCVQSLEKYEWDNVWWEHADTNGVPRVLYIGDSISCGTRRLATETAEEKIFFDGFGTSKAVDNPYFTSALKLFTDQQGERKVILFNNGLHGWHLQDDTQYAEHYERVVRFILDEYKDTPLVLVLTTYVLNDDARVERVKTRNNVVINIAKKYDLPTVDFFSLSQQNKHLYYTDGVHFTADGYKVLAEELVKCVKQYIN